jgi:CubicO group peptidase (beta-lactamase class C family)
MAHGVAVALLLASAGIPDARGGDLPVAGYPVPSLVAFDELMQAYMAQHSIDSGILAVSKDGVIIYQRGFGVDTPENTPMRLASLEKRFTQRAIQHLASEGLIEMTDQVFDLSECPGGILSHIPWKGLGDTRLCDITIQDIIDHRGGWDRDTASIGDPQGKTLQIAQEMGITPPAGRDAIIQYMLSEPLQFDPGTNGCQDGKNPTFCYSNFGYMVLGRVIEVVTGMDHLDFIRTHIVTPRHWMPNQEIIFGRTFAADQSPREPLYQCTNCNSTNVFDPDGASVPRPYGGWHHEAFLGHGNIVAGAAPVLTLMHQYNSNNHSGAIDGTSTMMYRRADGFRIVVLFAKRRTIEPDYAPEMASAISGLISDGGLIWPDFAVDGFWVDFHAAPAPIEVGGYHHPLRTMPQALNVGAGAKLRLKPGNSNWTGTISHRVLIDAPLGHAIIGQ